MKKKKALKREMIPPLKRHVLVRPAQVLQELRELVDRYPVIGAFFEEQLFEIFKYDNPMAVGWVAGDIDTAEGLAEICIDFERICKIYEADLEKYVKVMVEANPDEYLTKDLMNKSSNYVVIPRAVKSGKDIFTNDELWEILKGRFENHVKAEVQKEIDNNLDYYLPLGDA